MGGAVLDTLVTFGDSITAGTGASDEAHRWANILASALGYKLQNSGTTSTILQNTVQNTVATIGAAADNNGRDTYTTRVTAYSPKAVYILYGLNDLRLNDVAITLALFEVDLTEIITALVSAGITATNIVIGSPSYMTPANYADGSPYNAGTTIKHKLYVGACQNVAAIKGTKYADIYQAMIDGGGDTLMDVDGIHPDDGGHAAIATAFQSAATTTAKWYLAGGVAASSCIAAWVGKGAASYAASLVNLTGNSAYDLATITSPAGWTSAGWTFAGNDNILNTGINPASDASYTIIARFNQTGTPVFSALMGAVQSSGTYNGTTLWDRNSGNRYYANDGEVAIAGGALTGAHVLAVAGRQPYLDGATDGAAFADDANAMPTAVTICFGGCRVGANPGYPYGGTLIAMAVYSAALSGAQIVAITTAMNAL